MTNLRPIAVVPAAGLSSRFGGMKLVADVGGEPLLNRTIRCLVEAGLHRVVVVLSPTASFDGVALLQHPRVTVVRNPDPSRGMWSSIQVGLSAAEGSPVVVLPADMPFVRSATVSAVVAECQATGRVVVATLRGRRGHPVALPGRVRDGLLSADSGGNLRDALRTLAGPPLELYLDDPGVLRDVDVPADLDSRDRTGGDPFKSPA